MTTVTEPPAPSVRAKPVPAPLGPLRRTVLETGYALITLGIVVFLFVAYQLWGTNLTEARNQSRLAQQFAAERAPERQPATATTPTTAPDAVPLPTAPPGNAIDHLVIPKLGLDKFVVEGVSEADLRRGPGHYPGTVLPGQVGNAAIAGHRTTYGAPFFRLDAMSPGDPIYLTDLAGRTWVYKVSGPPEVVRPSDVSVLKPTTFAQLTLTTCNPRFSATSRLILFARLQGQALPPTPAAPAPAASTTPAAPAPDLAAADDLGSGSSTAWSPFILYGLGAIALWIIVRILMARVRGWRRAGVFVAGAGLCLIPLWFCFENAVLLLPQSI